MRIFCFILLIPLVLNCISAKTSIGQVSDKQAQKAIQIVKNNPGLPDSIRQLIVVFSKSPEDSLAVLVPLEKKTTVGTWLRLQ